MNDDEQLTLTGGPVRRPPRPRDERWDALVAVCGYAPQTKSERGRFNAALKQLRDADATTDEIHKRAGRYRELWPNVTLTPTALAANWGVLAVADSNPFAAIDWTTP